MDEVGQDWTVNHEKTPPSLNELPKVQALLKTMCDNTRFWEIIIDIKIIY